MHFIKGVTLYSLCNIKFTVLCKALNLARRRAVKRNVDLGKMSESVKRSCSAFESFTSKQEDVMHCRLALKKNKSILLTEWSKVSGIFLTPSRPYVLIYGWTMEDFTLSTVEGLVAHCHFFGEHHLCGHFRVHLCGQNEMTCRGNFERIQAQREHEAFSTFNIWPLVSTEVTPVLVHSFTTSILPYCNSFVQLSFLCFSWWVHGTNKLRRTCLALATDSGSLGYPQTFPSQL